MTSQEHASAALLAWQELRDKPPQDRMAILMSDFFMSEDERQYENTLRRVTEEMAHV